MIDEQQSIEELIQEYLDRVDVLPTHRELCKALNLPPDDRMLAKVLLQEKYVEQKILSKPQMNHEPQHLMGIFQTTKFGGEIHPLYRKNGFKKVLCNAKQCATLNTQDIVKFKLGRQYQILSLEKVGTFNDERMFSQIAILEKNIPHEFSKQALQDASTYNIPSVNNRVDLRDIPLVTIDGEDARDFDDAVWATPDHNPQNSGGWRAIVAIADVSYYVRLSSKLDEEAFERGNSIYFPDRVVPMLPEVLSNGLCSLKPHEDRACLAVEMVISPHGKIISSRFKRGLMRSKARLTYDQVQHAIDGKADATTAPLLENVIQPLYGVYKALLHARHKRGTIEFEMPEHKVIFDQDGMMCDIKQRVRYDSHKLIEELMIAANVCAAKALLAKKWHALYRVHDVPDSVRVQNLRQILQSQKIKISKPKNLIPSYFNSILHMTENHPSRVLIHQLVLRCQAQARYAPEPHTGHFGLSLAHYCHFTSPIRRYADLQVHRALISALGLGEAGQDLLPIQELDEMGWHLSHTERLAAQAERSVVERFTALWLLDKVGHEFNANITGVNRAGLFVSIYNGSAEGFIPVDAMRGDYFQFDEKQHRFIGRRTRKIYQMGDTINVALVVVDPITCSVQFEIVQNNVEKKFFPKKNHTSQKQKDKVKDRRQHSKKKNLVKFDNAIEGKLVKRYKRFLADVELLNGDVVTVHCPNSGAMTGVLHEGSPVIITKSSNPKRALPYTWQMVFADDEWVGVNTHNTNELVHEALVAGKIEPLLQYPSIKREVKYGQNSRIDFLLNNDQGELCYVEVKNVHLKRGETALFPDSKTERGLKHLHELMNMKSQGIRSVVLYIIQRESCNNFQLADDIDPDYAKGAAQALQMGVEMYAFKCLVDPCEIKIHQSVEGVL